MSKNVYLKAKVYPVSMSIPYQTEKPMVYVDFPAIPGYPDNQTVHEGSLSIVLAHERAHLKRGDHWWKLLGLCAVTDYDEEADGLDSPMHQLFNGNIGIKATNLEKDIRSSQKITEDWVVEGNVSGELAAFISYPDDKAEHTFSVIR